MKGTELGGLRHDTNTEKKMLMITNIMGPLRFLVYRSLAKDGEFQLRMLFLSRTDANRQWDIHEEEIAFEYTLLPGKNFYLLNLEIPLYFNWGLVRETRRYQPDVIVIAGYNHLATLQVLLYAKKTGARTVLWTYTSLHHTPSRV